jgi:hypothetical protein
MKQIPQIIDVYFCPECGRRHYRVSGDWEGRRTRCENRACRVFFEIHLMEIDDLANYPENWHAEPETPQ